MSEFAREALLQSELQEAQRLLSDEMGIALRDCSTVIFLSTDQPKHYSMPAWINPYDSRIIEDEKTLLRWSRQGKPPKTMYQQRINELALKISGLSWDDMDWQVFRDAKEKALAQLREDLRVFLTGFTDIIGNYWCGSCYSRCQFMNIGADLKYPPVWMSRTESGYDAWLWTARNCGYVALEDGLRLARRIKAERRQAQLVEEARLAAQLVVQA